MARNGWIAADIAANGRRGNAICRSICTDAGRLTCFGTVFVRTLMHYRSGCARPGPDGLRTRRSGNRFRLCRLGSRESCRLVWGCQEKRRRIRSREGAMTARWRARGVRKSSRTNSQRYATVETEWLMGAMVVRRSRKAGSLVWLVFGLAIASGAEPAPVRGGLGSRHVDPAQILPLDQIPTEHRESVSEVIRDHTFHRLGETDSFPCPQPLSQSAQRAARAADSLERPEYVASAASENRPESLPGNRRLGLDGRLGLRASELPAFTYSSPISTMSALMGPPESRPGSSWLFGRTTSSTATKSHGCNTTSKRSSKSTPRAGRRWPAP